MAKCTTFPVHKRMEVTPPGLLRCSTDSSAGYMGCNHMGCQENIMCDGAVVKVTVCEPPARSKS